MTNKISLLMISVLLLFALVVAEEELVEMSDTTSPETSATVESDDAAGEEFADLLNNSTSNQIFPPNITKLFVSLDSFSLEDFATRDLSDAEEQPHLIELVIEFRLLQFLNQTVDEMNSNYGRAFDKLLSIVPQLRILHPISGHFYYPDNGTMQDVFDEVTFVRKGLEALTGQMTQRNLTLTDDKFDYIKYTLYIVIDELEFNSTELDAELRSQFGKHSLVMSVPSHSTLQTMTVLYDVNDINIKLDVLVYTDGEAVLDTGLESGERLDYKKVVLKLSDLDQLEMKADQPFAKFLS
ncbi:hypothetical protein M3Y98_01183600 [Aphelenchoides besseyi]|nr:hypothetical protein M3Y98_01183600 [Aphelenchoides besseyi]KAI6211101.1 hypothetical protein M3Y96_00397500 [Aphelenchoides besseyi]